jgi:hypothetical protein
MNYLRLPLFALATLLMIGCASNGQLRDTRLEALQASDSARRTADEALAEARTARQIAEDTRIRTARNEEMVNRGFRNSMQK